MTPAEYATLRPYLSRVATNAESRHPGVPGTVQRVTPVGAYVLGDDGRTYCLSRNLLDLIAR
jgi:hypothetical protein